MSKTNKVFCDEPNKFARPPKLESLDHSFSFHGYQEFVLTKTSITIAPDDLNLQNKQALLAPYFCPRYLARRTLLDLGANSGFFSFWALQNGAAKAIAVDIDDEYLRMIGAARESLEFENLQSAKSSIAEWEQPGDVVLALALIHWVYSCTALFGSLDAVVERLAQLTNYMLIVEWIDPADPAIDFFHHLDWNQEEVSAPYSLAEFETALTRHFDRYQIVGDVSATRRLYVAFRHPHEMDLSGPMPFAHPVDSIISARLLTNHEGIDYWSYLFEADEVIYKQGTLDLAAREAYFLAQLGSVYFPRLLATKTENDYSVITLEKIHGLPLERCYETINSSLAFIATFFRHALDALAELKSLGIVHRDIRPNNILVRESKPVLIDFGWAISEEQPFVTPPELGSEGRPPEGIFCDVYSMGKVFAQVNQHKYAGVDAVIDLITDPDASMRISDLTTLKTLFASLDGPHFNNAGGTLMATNGVDLQENEEAERARLAIAHLLEQLQKRNQKLALLRNENEQLTLQLAQHEQEGLSRDHIEELECQSGRVTALERSLPESKQQLQTKDGEIRELQRQAEELKTLIFELTEKEEAHTALSAQLQTQVRSEEERSALLSTQLVEAQTQLTRIRETLGWRLLNNFGRVKYGFLLPVFRLFRQTPAERTPDKPRGYESDKS